MTTYFFDENLSHRLAAALVAFGQDVRHVRDEFGLGTPDEVWLPVVGKKAWILVTGDHNIRRRKHQRKELQDANVTAFFIDMKGFANLGSGLLQAAWLFQRWDEIIQTVDSAKRGSHFEVKTRATPRVRMLPRL